MEYHITSSDLVTSHNDVPMTTSLKVASEVFGKLHKNVIRDIQHLDCSEEFTRLNFERSEYIDPTGRKLPMYLMTRDGFTFLAMSDAGATGFTGL